MFVVIEMVGSYLADALARMKILYRIHRGSNAQEFLRIERDLLYAV